MSRRESLGLVVLICAFAAGCGDDSSGTGTGTGGGGGGTTTATTTDSASGSTTTSTGSTTTSTGAGATTPESVTEARCATVDSDEATALDGGAEPPTSIQPETLYEMELYQVNEPTQFVGFAEVEITEAGRYLMLILDLSNDGFAGGGGIRELEGEPEVTYVPCDGCAVACDEVESSFVYDLPVGTYEVVILGQEQPVVRFVLAQVD